jgi:histidinol-phosphate aminotransferase
LPPYVPGEQPAPGRRVVKLNTNENPYPPSPRVVTAVAAQCDERIRLYPDPQSAALRAKASAVYGVPPDHVLAGNGSDELLALLFRATVDPGDRVAFPVPTYSLYEVLAAVQGATLVRPPWNADWTVPAALATADARLTFLCNPNSPSGTLVPVPAIEELARAVAGILVVDEAYIDFAPPDAAALSLVGQMPNVVVLRTFSKAFSLCGLRVGLAFAHPDVIAGLDVVRDSYNLDRLAQAGAVAALDDLAHMHANADRVRATRYRLGRALAELGYDVVASHANFLLARTPGRDQAPIAAALADAGILVRHFATPQLHDALRITVGADDEVDALLTALRRLVG